MTTSLRVAVRRFGPFETAIEKVWRDLNTTGDTGLRLDAVALDLNPLQAELLESDGLLDGTWDVVFANTDWIAELVGRGLVIDLAPLMARFPVADFPAGWVPSLLEAQQVGAHVYGLPFHDGPECCIYRRDLFEDACERAAFRERYGYDLQPPRTWQQFDDIAHFFTRPDQDLYGTVFAAFPDGHNSVYDFCLHLWSRGGDVTDGNGAITLDTPAAVAALDFYRRIVRDATATYPDAHEIDSVRAGEIFANGEAAMMINWFGFAAVCEQPDCAVKGRVAIGEIPVSEGVESVSLSVYWILAIATGSRHKEAAFQLLRHAATPAMDKQTTLEGAIGCRLSTWQDAEVNRAIPFYRRLVDLTPGARTLPRSRAFPALAHIIDGMVQEALMTETASADIARRAQERASGLTL